MSFIRHQLYDETHHINHGSGYEGDGCIGDSVGGKEYIQDTAHSIPMIYLQKIDDGINHLPKDGQIQTGRSRPMHFDMSKVVVNWITQQIGRYR
jgi:hypothetical protein